MYRRILIKSCAIALSLFCLTGPMIRSQVNPLAYLRPDPTNKQYFYYNNQTQAMVGTSGEYLPHINQVNSNFNRNNTYCTLANFRSCVNEIRSKGMNRMRLWVGMNFSPGSKTSQSAPTPYPHEQGFKYSGGKWNLDDYDDQDLAGDLDDGFFTNIRKVIAYCNVAPAVFVEVTIFAPWGGKWELGPWHKDRNTLGKSFTNPSTGQPSEDYFLRLDNPNFNLNLSANDTDNKTDLNDSNRELRKRQVAMMKHLVDYLWDLKNFYWEIANEADYNINSPQTELLLWHRYMMKELYDYEATKGVHHMIAVNFASDTALEDAKTMPYLDIVNTHYIHLWPNPNTGFPPSSGYNGSISTIRKYNVWTGTLNKVFGFNESRITGFFADPSYGATADSTRVGAWEFMMNEGGIVDHLNYDWVNFSNPSANNSDSTNANLYLGMLNKFLRKLPLATMQKKLAPTWVVNWPAYPARSKTTVGKYFGTMNSGENVYVLYIHYSKISSHSFAMYIPDTTTLRTESLTLQALGQCGNFKYEWFDPKNLQFDFSGNPVPEISSTIFWQNVSGEVAPIISYSFRTDALLRVTRLSTC